MFSDRTEAGKLLAEKLKMYEGTKPLILAIPRGAVPVGDILARKLGGELDIILVHKIGAPGNPEFAIGAVTESGEVLLGEAADFFSISKSFVASEAKKEIQNLKAKRRLYSTHAKPESGTGRTVILVDDGIATGQTMLAAVKALKIEKPARVIVATPVISASAYELLAQEADEVVAAEVPPTFLAVGEFYESFPQVSDEEVIRILKQPKP